MTQAKRTSTADYLFNLINTEDSMNFADELEALGSDVPGMLDTHQANKHKVYERNLIHSDSEVCRYCANWYDADSEDNQVAEEAIEWCSRCSNSSQFVGIEAYRVV